MAYIVEVQGENYNPISENQNWGPALQSGSPFGDLRVLGEATDAEASTFPTLEALRPVLLSLRINIRMWLIPGGFDCLLRVRDLETDEIVLGPF